MLARRVLVEKKTTKTGLLGGGRRTTYDYRLAVENGAGKAIRLELWDRMPVSRAEQIAVELVDPSHPLATDTDYIEEQRPRGLLKWLLNVPPAALATGDPRPASTGDFVITYGVRVARAKDVDMTPLPE